MQERNPYAPPEAPVSDVGANKSASTGELPFFPVSVFKLTLMSIFTLGLYQAYWFYKNWQRVRHREGRGSAFWRAFFGPIFCYALFARVRDYDQPGLTRSNLWAGPLAVGWIAANIAGQVLPEPYVLLAVLTVAFLLPVQARVNEINGTFAPRHERNDRLTGLNWVAIVLCGVLYAIAILGTLGRPVELDGVSV